MKFFSVIALLLLTTVAVPAGGCPAASSAMGDQAAPSVLQNLVQAQHSAMIGDNLSTLRGLYAPEAASTLKVSEIRARYLANWAKLRGIVWTGIHIKMRILTAHAPSPHRLQFYAIEREQYQYHYADLPQTSLWFGIASWHHLSLVEREGQWHFGYDDFTNPVQPSEVAGQTVPGLLGGKHPSAPLSAHRAAAVSYANTYCGNAPGCGNNGHYNTAFRDYNGNGGDCTSWISQVLQAGGFSTTQVWNYDHATHQGSDAWANAGVLAEFLRESGRATIFAEGPYQTIAQPSARYPDGAVQTLIPGDLISYQKRGAIVHTAVVVGYDPKGVIITDTHTNDRYHVPWDFGWSDHTVFYLWHVHYPTEAKARRTPPSYAPEPAAHDIRHDHNPPLRPT